MTDSERQAVVDAAVKSHKSHPNVPAINVLEVVLRGKAGLLFSVPTPQGKNGLRQVTRKLRNYQK